MVKFQIQAVERQNFKGVSRAGRFWPSTEATEVVVHDQDADPAPELKDGVSTIHTETPRRIGRLSFEMLKADRRLRIINSGDPMNVETELVANLRAKFDAAWDAQKEAHAHELVRVEERHAEDHAAWQGQTELLRAEVAQLKAHAAQLEADAVQQLDEIAALKAMKGGELAPSPADTELQNDEHDTEPGKKSAHKGAGKGHAPKGGHQ